MLELDKLLLVVYKVEKLKVNIFDLVEEIVELYILVLVVDLVELFYLDVFDDVWFEEEVECVEEMLEVDELLLLDKRLVKLKYKICP